MCGPNSAIGLEQAERDVWPDLRERLRVPGQLMGLMRGVLGGDTEVAAIIATSPEGSARPLAVLVTPGIAEELNLNSSDRSEDGWITGRIGEYDVEVLTRSDTDADQPVAVRITPWIYENLYLYARKLWSKRHA